MTEREAEQVLRRWYSDEIGRSLVATDVLRARVVAIPRAAGRVEGSRGTTVLLIAATLMLSTAMLVAVAIGSGMVQLPTAIVEPSPTNTPQATTTAPIASPFTEEILLVEDEPIRACDRDVRDGVAIDFLVGGQGSADHRLLVLQDGQVHEGSTATEFVNGSPANVDAYAADWRQRRVTAAGLEFLTETVADASLPTCQTIYTVEGERVALTANLPEGVLHVNTGDTRLRVPTEAETTSMRRLIDHLSDLETWLPGEMWADDEWLAHQPQIWEVIHGDTPTPTPDLPDDALPDLDPCDYVPESVYPLFDMEREEGSRGPHWANCWFYAQHGDLDVHMRIRPTSTSQADSYALSLFGETDLASETIAGSTVYFNGCSVPPALACHAAIAISAEPYLIVFETNWHPTRDEWRELAQAVLGEIGRNQFKKNVRSPT